MLCSFNFELRVRFGRLAKQIKRVEMYCISCCRIKQCSVEHAKLSIALRNVPRVVRGIRVYYLV